MDSLTTRGTQRDKVRFDIIAWQSARLNMLKLEIA
jgi:hypothetical protein